MTAGARDATVVTLVALSAAGAWVFVLQGRSSTGRWPGVDEAVVARFVEDSGRRVTPLLDWVQGDLLLFAFLTAGLLAGFVLGFFARAAFGSAREAN